MTTASQLADIEKRLAAVEKRLSALEAPGPVRASVKDDTDEAPSLGEGFLSSITTHIGRVLLIFGGAYLLRAITDFQFVPVPAGLFIGALYAVFWLVMAYRRGAIAHRGADAAFYGGTSTLLALPLLVEASTRFGLLSGNQAVVALLGYLALALFVADRRQLRSLAWLAVGGGIATAFALLFATSVIVAVAVLSVLLGLASYWVVQRHEWMGLQWLGAAGANAVVLVAIGLSRSDQWSLEGTTALLFAAVLLLVYLLSFVLRSTVQGKPVGVFEVAQTLAATALALAASLLAARYDALELGRIGALILILGAVGYGLSLSPANRSARGRDFFYYSTFGLIFLLAGTLLVFSPLVAAFIWSLLAVVMAIFSGRLGWVTLSLQCTALLLAAGIASGLLDTGIQALSGDVTATWPVPTYADVVIAMATVACLFIPVTQHSQRWGAKAGMPQLLVLALSVWEVGGLFVLFVGPVLAGAGSAAADAAIIAAIRTAVLSVAAVSLALSSRFPRWPEARWLVYPVLILVGIKLFAEDFPNGEPATLFVSLAFIGSALIIVAKLLRR
ncbi:MAG: hypothetical protein P8X81_06300 [Woeseiaceae bacterium]